MDEKGRSYWEYVLLYVDDALCISTDPKSVLEKEIGKYWTLKPGSLGPPTLYLGNKVSRVTLENGVSTWSFSSSQYIQNAIKNVELYLRKSNRKLSSYAPSPFATGYRPEIDTSILLNSSETSYYQSLIGILRWIVELGRIDLTCEVSMMASMMALPRKGHLDQLFHIFSYLKKRHNKEIVFDPTVPDIDPDRFPEYNWDHTPYKNSCENIPENAPETRGFGFTMIAFVDSDHAGDHITRRSRTGFLIKLNNSPIYWSSKKQSGVETSSFGSEFMALKQCCEYVRGLRYKLRMMGISINGPTYIYGDNKSVLTNSSIPDSVLKKKSNSIAYHFVREGVYSGEWKVTYIKSEDNVADMLTKPLSAIKRQRLLGMVLHHSH